MREALPRRPLRSWIAWAFLGCGLALIGSYAAAPRLLSPLVLLGPVVAVVVIVVGARRNAAPGHRGPWYALAAALGCFVGAAVLREIVPGASAKPPGPAAAIPDVLTLPGYLLFGYALLSMLRRRGGASDRSANADAALFALAAALATWAFLLAPAVGVATIGTWPQVAAAAFPFIDVFLLTLAVRLVVAGGVRPPALWLLTASTASALTLDLVGALTDESVVTATELLIFDVLFMVGYLAAAAAALHPGMSTLTEPQHSITRELGPARITGIVAVLIAPTVLAYVVPAPNLGNIVVRVALTAVLAITVIGRIMRSHDAQARAEQRHWHRFTHDALTDLPNRELLLQTIGDWSRRATGDQQISLLFLDLDRFKAVNDSWGHRVGDELLRALAGRLRSMVRSTDLVCRLGGDEFVIAVLSPSDSDLAVSLAQRVVREVAAPFPLSTGEVIVTPSVGVVHATGDVDPVELIRDADTAMYQAKGVGGNTYADYDSSRRDKAAARVALEQALRGALGRGELSVHYQPIIGLTGDELIGFEALMRWRHPQLGAVSPVDFIPIAEETGLIVASGAWLLNESLDQLASWRRDRDEGLPELHVSVNISPRQLRDDSIVAVVEAALSRVGLPPSALWLEITESVMIEEPQRALRTLDALKNLGVTLCIDDFGTGYASLSYVRQMPAQVVKVDRLFIKDVHRQAGDAAIVISVIAMAHALGQQIVAEGVETVEQRDWLRAHGCDLVQGYLYGRPGPAADITASARTLPARTLTTAA